MPTRIYVSWNYAIQESRGAYDFWAKDTIPGTDISYNKWTIGSDRNENSSWNSRSESWESYWNGPNNGYDYAQITVGSVSLVRPPDFIGPNGNISTILVGTSPRNKYSQYFVDDNELSALRKQLPPEQNDLGIVATGADGSVSVVDSVFGSLFGAGRSVFVSAPPVGVGSIPMSADVSARVSARFAGLSADSAEGFLTDAAAALWGYSGKALGLVPLFTSISNVATVGRTLREFHNKAFEVFSYGLANFERLDATEFDRLVDRLLRDARSDFLGALGDVSGLDLTGDAAQFVTGVNLSVGPLEIEATLEASIGIRGTADVFATALPDPGRHQMGAQGGLSILSEAVSVVDGSETRDVIVNLDNSTEINGDDTIRLRGGDDVFLGGDRQENIYAGNGRDTIRAGRGNDDVYGESGDDFIFGQLGDDDIWGDTGNDWLDGGSGADEIYGGEGADTIFGGLAGDTLPGNASRNYSLWRDDGASDILAGGAGRDEFHLGFGDIVKDFETGERAFIYGLDGPGGGLDRSTLAGERDGSGWRVVARRAGDSASDSVELARFENLLESDRLVIEPFGSNGASVAIDTRPVQAAQTSGAFEDRPMRATAPAPRDLSDLRDYDGVDLGSAAAWVHIGTADVQGDGDAEHIYINPKIGRWATVGPDTKGWIDFGNHGANGDTRVVGIYIDPEVAAGRTERFGPFDSQQRFQNDLRIDNLAVIDAFDFDRDGFQEIYFKIKDGTAYLRALMHLDGNIQYANYQSRQQVEDYITGLGYQQDVLDMIIL